MSTQGIIGLLLFIWCLITEVIDWIHKRKKGK
jgi:hypothetical protein